MAEAEAEEAEEVVKTWQPDLLSDVLHRGEILERSDSGTEEREEEDHE